MLTQTHALALSELREEIQATLRSRRARIFNVDKMEDFRAAEAVLDRIWGTDQGGSVPAEVLLAMAEAGNYVAATAIDGQIVGVACGFHGVDGVLHSHILGVVPAVTGRSLGYLLKQHQRMWALERGMTQMTWTFDPLIRRNAHFNFTRLGAAASSYEPNHYGAMTDAINSGDESDRIIVMWQLDRLDPPVGLSADPRAQVVLTVGSRGEPIRSPIRSEHIVLQVPPDIEQLRKDEPNTATAWRFELRQAVQDAAELGLWIKGMNDKYAYVLERR